MTTIPLPDAPLTTEEASAYLSVSPRTMESWRLLSKGPPYLQVEGVVRYLPSDLRNWLNSSKVNPSQ